MRDNWDFLTPYLKLILGTTGLHDLTFFSVEGTGAGPESRRRGDAQDRSSAASALFALPRI
jgi:FMN-dependent NADH-azoreductase